MTIKLSATPAEESGGGTGLLLQRGVFHDVATAMTVHPAPEQTYVRISQAAPDIVPADTWARYYLHDLLDVGSLYQLEVRVRACFDAGALATGCAHKVTQVGPGYTQLVPDPWLAAAYRGAITGIGRSPLASAAERNVHTVSTDMGNVTQAMPAIHPIVVIDCGDAVNHQPEFAGHRVGASARRR